jgi:hypothetical protein
VVIRGVRGIELENRKEFAAALSLLRLILRRRKTSRLVIGGAMEKRDRSV